MNVLPFGPVAIVLCGMQSRYADIPQLTPHDRPSNLPGGRKLWLIDRREVLALLDPQRMGAADGWTLGPGGLQLAEDAVVHAWQFRAWQAQYTETPARTDQGESYRQQLVLTLPDSPLTTLAIARMSGREWVGVFEDANFRWRVVGHPNQPLRVMGGLVATPARVLTFVGDTRLPGPFLSDPDIFSLDAEFSNGFSYDFFS